MRNIKSRIIRIMRVLKQNPFRAVAFAVVYAFNIAVFVFFTKHIVSPLDEILSICISPVEQYYQDLRFELGITTCYFAFLTAFPIALLTADEEGEP